jgi:hypothetical protein
MSEEQRRNRKAQLARAIAAGQSVAKWSQQNGVPKRTAYRWAKEAKVKAAVNSHRRRAIDRSLGRLADKLADAADSMIRLSEKAQSESVQLSAIKGMFDNVVAMAKFSALEERINELEGQFHARTGSAGCEA